MYEMDGSINDEAEKIQSLGAILGEEIPLARLRQILEASNGSIEHAIEIFFHQQEHRAKQDHETTHNEESFPQTSSPTNSALRSNSATSKVAAGTKRSQPTLLSIGKGKKSPSKKQARLDSFFAVSGRNALSSKKTDTKNKLVDQHNKSDSHQIPLKEDVVELDEVLTIEKISKQNAKYPSNSSTSLHTKTDASVTRVLAPAATPAAAPAVKESLESCNSTISFERFADMLQQLTDTTKRNSKLDILKTFICEMMEIKGADLLTRTQALTSALELVLGGNTSQPLNISSSAVSKALQLSLGVSRNQLSKAYRQYGDLGDCAASFFQKKTFFVTSTVRHLSVIQVTHGMEKICLTDGRDAKQHIILDLLRRCQSKLEIRFLVRLLVSCMRVGANLKTVLAALAMAVMSKTNPAIQPNTNEDSAEVTQIKEAVTMVQKTHDICPSIEKIVFALLEGGLEQMKRDCTVQVHIPISPMLAHPIHSLNEVDKVMEKKSDGAVMEFKYDGMRLQAHYDGRTIKLFSRHMLETTSQFPEVAMYLIKAFQATSDVKNASCETSFIIDAEVVGVEEDEEGLRLLPFQDLSTRRKKNTDGKGVRVKVFAFDLMFLDGVSLVSERLGTRRSRLMERFQETSDFSFVKSKLLPRYDESLVTEFLKHSIECGAEGIMVKTFGIDTAYEAGTRSHSWLKVKRDYVGDFADTIDVVPIGAWYGNGRKAQKSFLSPVLLAVYDDQEDIFRSICRCMSFTDAMYESMREFYFRGTPYAGDGGRNNQLGTVQEGTNSSEQSDEESEDECDEISAYGDFDDGIDDRTEDRVNCFPSRPSSSVLVTNESPPIWFKPLEVFEVSFADLSLSRQHTAAAGLVDEAGRGIALRFPRFKRRRPDKTPEQATTSIQIAQLFSKQSKIKVTSRPD
jgi:DNA ligase 1